MVTPYGRKPFSTDIKAVDITAKVLKFRELLKDPENTGYLPIAQELYDIIIRPMEQELSANGISTILWMLTGALRLLPLVALHDGKQFLLENFCNVCITTISKIGRTEHEPWNGLGMGVTKEHEGHPPLPAVKEELEGIIRQNGTDGIIPGEILLDGHFTRQAMESFLDGGYKAVHFASHFELNPVNETLSYLLLGDGSKIRMDELRCSIRLFKGVDLVAFSACSTGLGTASTKGREVDGIGYLGERQGAKTVLATLWPVEDKSTSMVMREFYRLREEGMTKAKALQQAQLCLLNGKITSEDGHDFTHPYFWAPFILIGNSV
jgi:CHAT domain-containing protein